MTNGVTQLNLNGHAATVSSLTMGGTSGVPIPFKSIPLHLGDGTPNRSSVVACAVLDGITVTLRTGERVGLVGINGSMS